MSRGLCCCGRGLLTFEGDTAATDVSALRRLVRLQSQRCFSHSYFKLCVYGCCTEATSSTHHGHPHNSRIAPPLGEGCATRATERPPNARPVR
jgi:hypothetical protein